MEREGCLAKKRERRALAGNRTRVSRVGGENSTTEPPMPRLAALGPGSFRRSVGKLFFFFFFGKTSFYGPTTDRELPGVLGFSICDSEMRMKH